MLGMGFVMGWGDIEKKREKEVWVKKITCCSVRITKKLIFLTVLGSFAGEHRRTMGLPGSSSCVAIA